jgi:SAM-dependent methyltransferase
MSNKAVIESNWYDYPQYYDIAFQSETLPEADFIEAACRKYCPFPARKLLEAACGTGRLVTALAARGYEMTGIDTNAAALDFLRRRLQRRKLRATIRQADMAAFQLPQPVDAAFCTFSSFRHLLTEEAARSNLECVADGLRPGGIYILGLHLLPPDASPECIERWREQHRGIRVSVDLRVIDSNRRKRIETLRVSLLVRRGLQELRIRDEFPLRLYTAAQIRKLLASVPCLELCDVYDFWYEIDQPLKLNNEISDTVFVLRKV